MILFRSEHRTYHKLMCTFVLAETVILCTAVPIVLVVENGEAEPAAAGANAGVEQASAQSVPVGRVFAGATAAITGLVLFSLVRRVSRHLVVMMKLSGNGKEVVIERIGVAGGAKRSTVPVSAFVSTNAAWDGLPPSLLDRKRSLWVSALFTHEGRTDKLLFERWGVVPNPALLNRVLTGMD